MTKSPRYYLDWDDAIIEVEKTTDPELPITVRLFIDNGDDWDVDSWDMSEEELGLLGNFFLNCKF